VLSSFQSHAHPSKCQASSLNHRPLRGRREPSNADHTESSATSTPLDASPGVDAGLANSLEALNSRLSAHWFIAVDFLAASCATPRLPWPYPRPSRNLLAKHVRDTSRGLSAIVWGDCSMCRCRKYPFLLPWQDRHTCDSSWGPEKAVRRGPRRGLLLLRGTASHEVAFGVCVTPV
jgi:hypothetical protein